MTPSMLLEELVAIDVHTHAEVSSQGRSSLDDALHDASAAYFKVEGRRKPTLEETAAYYRERKMAAVIFTVDAQSATGTPRYVFRGPARGPLAFGPGMTVAPCRVHGLGGGVTGPEGCRHRR